MRVKATRQILKVCSDAVGARVLGVVSMKGKPMVDICWIAIDKLTPNGRNARTHSRKQIRQIADSIEAFGFVVPILMDDDGVIIAGHGRYAAAKLLDLKQVPAIRLGELSEAKRRALALADNKIGENAGWDRERLAIELPALADRPEDVIPLARHFAARRGQVRSGLDESERARGPARPGGTGGGRRPARGDGVGRVAAQSTRRPELRAFRVADRLQCLRYGHV